MKNILYIMVFLQLLLTSCENGSIHSSLKVDNEIPVQKELELLEPSKYVQWVQDKENGLKKEKIIEDITFSVQYKPLEYIICLEEKQNELKESEVKNKIEELKDMEYYDLTIMLNNQEQELLKYKVSSPYEYDQRVKYFAFEMQIDIQLVDGNDTIPCALYHFERTYDVAPFSKFLLGFPKNENRMASDKVFILHDKTFKKGIIKFTYSKEELNSIPQLKTL